MSSSNALGATNTKRFDATVRALLKSNQESGELALAVLEGRANSSKESLVLFEPRAKFKRFSSLLLGDGPTTIEKALVVNAVHSYRTFWLELDVPFAERRAASTATVFGSRRPALVQ